MAARAKKIGDSVDLGEHGTGQIWASAPGNMNWHAVDENQRAHIYNERSGSSYPSRSSEFELGEYKAKVDQKYSGIGYAGRRGYLNDTEADALSKTKGPNYVRPKRVRKVG